MAEACVALATAARALLQQLQARNRARHPRHRRGGRPRRLGLGSGGARRLAAGRTGSVAPRGRACASGRASPSGRSAPPPPPPGNAPVSAEDARARLAALLGDGAEARPQQADYAAAVAAAFAPRERPDAPQAVLAEAGTGVGKTLGYIAPASLWAEKNQGAVWISTFTRNLQSQIAGELDRLYPDPGAKAPPRRRPQGPRELPLPAELRGCGARGDARAARNRSAPLALIARWIGATAAGDLVGGDFPGWLAELIGRGRVNALADRRGECIHSACPHFRRCFVEKNVRAARHARLVVANHALVMAQAALGGLDDATVPTRYVFDEGHHLFEAADAAFSVRLSGQEGRELRRWLLGAEAGRSRARGLQRRIGDLVEADERGRRRR